jgi:hypothetical protein
VNNGAFGSDSGCSVQSSSLYEDSTTHQTCARLCSAPAAGAALTRLGRNAKGHFTSCAFVDVNRDGHLDLVLGSMQGWSQPRETLLLNDGHGHFSRAPASRLAPHSSPI